MKNNRSLSERLGEYAASGALPMHMPGHKRNLSAAPWLAPLGGGLDITEIGGFDDLHHARGILKDEMDRAAALWGAERTFFLVNGSSCGLLAVMYALGPGGRLGLGGRLGPGGGTAIVARNCHKSVYHGLELCGLTPKWLRPDWCGALGIWGSVPPAAVERALEETPEARFVLLTSPTYDGVLSDIAAISALCHDHGVPLIVDEAHGAHLGFGGFPDGAVKLGADIVVHSAHKTLPSLTQTALLHIRGGLADGAAVERALGIFETSSPSYVLLASLSGCVRFLERPGALGPWRAGLDAFDREIGRIEHLHIPNHGNWAEESPHHRHTAAVPPPLTRGASGVFGWDPGKIVLFGMNGFSLMDALRGRFGIELEMSCAHYALAMTGAGDGENSLRRLARALAELDGEADGEAVTIPGPPPEFPPAPMGLGEALRGPFSVLPLGQAAGRVCAQYLWAYPPGVPLAVPGEELTPALLEQLAALVRAGAGLRASPAGPPGTVRVLDSPAETG